MTANEAVFPSAVGGRHRRTQLLPSTRLPVAGGAAATGDRQREQPVRYFLALQPGGVMLGRDAAIPALPTAVRAASPPGIPPAPYRWWRWPWASLRRNYYALLTLVLVVQAGLSLRLVWSNTAFQDEALYLWAGHREIDGWLHGTPIPNYALSFSGSPVVYPPLGALADSVGGLAAARILSLGFMLGSTVLLFAVASRIFGKRAGLAAAALFAVLGPAQVLGAFATYDPMAVFLLALASFCVVRAQGRAGEAWLVGAALAMGLADAAKYASLLWNPVVILLAVFLARGGRMASALRGLRLATYAATLVAIALLRFGGPSYIHGVFFTTLVRQVGGRHTTVAVVAHNSFDWVGIVLVLAIGGTVAAFRSESSRIRWLALVLTTAIVLAPVNQARIHDLTSLHKHVVYGAWFSAIVAGYALNRLMEFWRVRNWLVALTAAAAAIAGVQQSARIFEGWPDTSVMTASVSTIVNSRNCPCLISENNVVSYYLLRQTVRADLLNLYYFRYRNPGTNQVLSGLGAYKAAIANHYFGVVELDANEVPLLYRPVLTAMESAAGYRLTKVTPSNVPGEPIVVWQYTGRGGAAPGQQAALARELHFRVRQVSPSPLGGLLTPPAILRPFLATVAVSMVGTGLFVFMLMLAIRLCWRRRKAAEEI